MPISNEEFPEDKSQVELIFGLVGPIGVDIGKVGKSLDLALREFNYSSHHIRVTELMKSYLESDDAEYENLSYNEKLEYRISQANQFCKDIDRKDAAVFLCIDKIQEIRNAITIEKNIPAYKNAYIIRQFKRPDEIKALRKVYGRKFIQISVGGSAKQRTNALMEAINGDAQFKIEPQEARSNAEKLIKIDSDQKTEKFGQRVSKIFHLADFFVDSFDPDLDKKVRRFVQLLFGHNGTTPSKQEYAMYAALAASLRSSDLSRQVGAAIFSDDGEVKSLGCNEVPAPGGGTYWGGVKPSHRDFEIGRDPNQHAKVHILNDLIKRVLSAAGYENDGTVDVDELAAEISRTDLVQESDLMSIAEYGRIIHAEMSAIIDAARVGKNIKGTTLYCTTFPCHMCAKHIVAAGIVRVIYIEPYPKSRALEMHADSIIDDESDPDKVQFISFYGVSPRRYRDLFEKGGRKGDGGQFVEFKNGKPEPNIEDKSGRYILDEDTALLEIGNWKTQNA